MFNQYSFLTDVASPARNYMPSTRYHSKIPFVFRNRIRCHLLDHGSFLSDGTRVFFVEAGYRGRGRELPKWVCLSHEMFRCYAMLCYATFGVACVAEISRVVPDRSMVCSGSSFRGWLNWPSLQSTVFTSRTDSVLDYLSDIICLSLWLVVQDRRSRGLSHEARAMHFRSCGSQHATRSRSCSSR